MDKQKVRDYLDQVDDDVDLVVMPRKILSLIEHKDIGMSDMTILQRLMGIDLLGEGANYHPRDKSDFGRCNHLLRDFPELKERLPEMSSVSPEWADLVSRWDELETDFHNRSLGRTSTVSYAPRDCCPECFEAKPCSCDES